MRGAVIVAVVVGCSFSSTLTQPAVDDDANPGNEGTPDDVVLSLHPAGDIRIGMSDHRTEDAFAG